MPLSHILNTMPDHPTEQVRQLILRTLSDLGATAEAEIRESILIRDGEYCGHKLRRDGLTAVWFIEEEEVKFFDRNGTLKAVKSASEMYPARADASVPRAA